METQHDRNNVALTLAVSLFAIIWIPGHWGPNWIANNLCFNLLGCNNGFFGYDALIHFTSGIMYAAFIIWLIRKYPKLNIFHEKFWKNLLIICAIASLIAFSWELGELVHDQFRMKVLHENLTVPNILDQPSDSDTMGDMTFYITGAALLTIIMKKRIDSNNEKKFN